MANMAVIPIFRSSRRALTGSELAPVFPVRSAACAGVRFSWRLRWDRFAATSRGGLVDLIGSNRGDAEFGRDRIDPLLRNFEVYVTVGSKVRSDVALIEPLRFIRPQPVQKRSDVFDGQTRLVVKCLEGSLVGSQQGLQRWAVERDMDGVHDDAHGGDLEVIADPGQQSETFFLCDLFG